MSETPPRAGTPFEITVPHQSRKLTRPSAARIRHLRRHLVEALGDLEAARRPDRLLRSRAPEPDRTTTAVLRAACAACRGQCCLGGGEHAWLDDRTMARVRRDHPEWNARRIVIAYLQHVAPLSYAGSCLFHGSTGCTLDITLRADLCSNYYCDGLTAFLRHRANQAGPDPSVTIIAQGQDRMIRRSIRARDAGDPACLQPPPALHHGQACELRD